MVCFLMETGLDKEGFEKLYWDFPFHNQIIMKQPDSWGGLASLWKSNVSIELVNFYANHILVTMKEEDGFVWHLTGFYVQLEVTQRTKSWALLNHLRTMVDKPWLCIGDFNAILYAFEKLSSHAKRVKLILFVMHLILVSLMTWAIKATRIPRTTKGWVMRTRRSASTELWPQKIGQISFK